VGTQRRAVTARAVAALAVLLAVAGVTAGCSGAETARPVAAGSVTGSGPVVTGSAAYAVVPAGRRVPAPTLRGSYLDGSAFRAADIAGKVTVVNVWASWCEPCKEELPALHGAVTALAPQGVTYLGIDVTDSASAAAAELRQLAPGFRSLSDRSGDLLRSLPGVPPSAVPSTVVLDRDGRVALTVIGRVDEARLTAALRQIAA
jgi:thiol-disulfide isomerase/thioredoxin